MNNLAVKMFAPGLGDLVMVATLLNSFIEKGISDKIILCVHNQGQKRLAERFSNIDKVILLDDKDPREYLDNKTFYLDMQKEPLENIGIGSQEYEKLFKGKHVLHFLNAVLGNVGLPTTLPTIKTEFSFSELNKTVLISVAGRRKTKLMPTKTWHELIRKIEKRGLEVALIGSLFESGADQIRELTKMGHKHLNSMGVNHTIDQINSCHSTIAIDGGLYHISSLLNKATIGIFGPVSSTLWGGLGNKTYNLDYSCGINCIGMPLNYECIGHPCMNNIRAEEIYELFLKEVLK